MFALLEQEGYHAVEVHQDLAGRDRMTLGRWPGGIANDDLDPQRSEMDDGLLDRYNDSC